MAGAAENLEPRVTALELAMERLAHEAARLHQELREFKDEMREFKNEMRADRRQLNRQLGEIARSQGRLVEDIVYPGARDALRTRFAIADFELYSMRVTRWNPRNREQAEFDLLASFVNDNGGGVIVGEAKSKPRPEDLPELIERVGTARECFPELANRALYGCYASLYVDETLVRAASKRGIVVLSVGEQLMEVVNEAGFTPSAF